MEKTLKAEEAVLKTKLTPSTLPKTSIMLPLKKGSSLNGISKTPDRLGQIHLQMERSSLKRNNSNFSKERLNNLTIKRNDESKEEEPEWLRNNWFRNEAGRLMAKEDKSVLDALIAMGYGIAAMPNLIRHSVPYTFSEATKRSAEKREEINQAIDSGDMDLATALLARSGITSMDQSIWFSSLIDPSTYDDKVMGVLYSPVKLYADSYKGTQDLLNGTPQRSHGITMLENALSLRPGMSPMSKGTSTNVQPKVNKGDKLNQR